MKKVVSIILIVIIIIIIILSNVIKKDETIMKEQQDIVYKELSDISNISESKIKESITTIKDNYQNIKDKKSLEKVVYSVTYLEFLTDKCPDSELSDLISYVNNYIDNKNDDNLKKITSYFNKIESKEDKLVKELYTNYNTVVTLEKILSSTMNIVNADLDDPNMLNEENINKAINYINSHYQEPYKNDEIINKLSYYSLYLSGLTNDSNNITELGISTLNYLQSLSDDDKKIVEDNLSLIKVNQKEQVRTLYEQISN